MQPLETGSPTRPTFLFNRGSRDHAAVAGRVILPCPVLRRLNPMARLVVFGQELNPESYAICKADMPIKGQDISNVVYGNTLSDEGLPGRRFDDMLSNPPFGVEWKKIEKAVRDEHAKRG